MIALLAAGAVRAQSLTVASAPADPAANPPAQITTTVPAPTTSSTSSPLITIDAPMAEDQKVLNVTQTNAQAPSLLAKTNTGVPLAVRLFLHQPVPESTNYFTETNVGTYVDGIYYSRSFGALYDFIDIDQIVIIPSAQGTLLGRNTVDGAVLINTRQPGNHLAATGDITYGSYNWVDLRAAISGPIVDDKLAASFSALERRRDGLMNAVNLDKYVNDRDYAAGRAKLLFTPTDSYRVTVTADAFRDRSSPKYPSSIQTLKPGQDPAANPNRDIFTTEAVTPDLNRYDQEGVGIVQDYQLDNLALQSITSYQDIASTTYNSYDATEANTLGTEAFVHQNRLTQDMNVSGTIDALSGKLGFFYLRKDTKQTTPTGGSPNFSRELDQAYALYGQAAYSITDQLELVFGARYTVEDKDFSSQFYKGNAKATRFGKTTPIPPQPPQADSDTWYGFTPRVGLDYQITPDILAYFSYTEGFKSGGWNNRLPPNYNAAGELVLAPVRYLPESATEYELGIKTSWLDNKLHFNAQAYIHDYDNVQIPLLAYAASTYYLTTAPKAQISGIEFDPDWQVTKELQLYGIITVQHGAYTAPFFCQNTAGTYVDCSANQLIGLAPLRALGGVVYTPALPIPGKLRVSLSLNYSDKYQNSVPGVAIAATTSHTLVDASINYAPDDHWSFTLEGRNLTNIHWFSTAAQTANSVVVYPDDPLTAVFRARYKL
jgi:iron complex outermembrane receptor protein